MDIPVRIVGGETVLVTFTGVGYDQRIMGDTLPVRDMGSTTVPDKQVVQVPKQVCVSVKFLRPFTRGNNRPLVCFPDEGLRGICLFSFS